MQEKFHTMYARHRNAAGLTQEKAAELLGVSVRSLANYELGVTIPPDTTVALMCDVYPAPMLALEHLRASSNMARMLIPAVTRLPLAQAANQLIWQVQDFTAKHRPEDLIRISANGKVDEGEQEQAFAEITEELEGIVQAAIQLRYAEGTGLPTDTVY